MGGLEIMGARRATDGGDPESRFSRHPAAHLFAAKDIYSVRVFVCADLNPVKSIHRPSAAARVTSSVPRE